MTSLLEHSEEYGTTRISTNLEELVRNEFFAKQKQTPAAVFPQSSERREVKEKWRNLAMAEKAHFSEIDIVRFYEDIILELQRELSRYKALAESARFADEAQPEESFVPRETAKRSEQMARKMRSRTQPGLRIVSSE